MVGDFGTTSDFHAKKKATDFGDYRLSEYPATFKKPSDYQIFPGTSDYQILTQASDYETDTEKSRFRNTQT